MSGLFPTQLPIFALLVNSFSFLIFEIQFVIVQFFMKITDVPTTTIGQIQPMDAVSFTQSLLFHVELKLTD
jgi:hypothetical protein